LKCIFQKLGKEFDTMEKDRNTMIDFLLAAYEGEPEYKEQEARLEALTDEQLTKEYEKAMEALNADTDIYDLLEFAH
jgi:hypothetical protein